MIITDGYNSSVNIMKNIKIIAEAGSNWNGDEKIAKRIIRQAKIAGADYVKFQMWKANELFDRTDPNWKFVKRAEFSTSLVKKLKKYAEECEIECFWSVFYPESIEILEDVGVKLYKIASWTAALKHKNALETMERVAITRKPVIISMGYGGDTKKIRHIFRNNKKYFLYCVPKYPTQIKEIEFNLMRGYDGFSDHTEGYLAPILFALQNRASRKVKFLEKHVSLPESEGPDKPFAMTMADFMSMVQELRKIKCITY